MLGQKTVLIVNQAKLFLLEKQLDALSKETQTAELAFREWEEEMNRHQQEQQSSTNSDLESWTKCKSELIIKGVHLASRISRFLKCILNGQGEGRTYTRSNAQHIIKMIVLVKVQYYTLRL